MRAETEAGKTKALLFLDLDDFKHVNDSLGPGAGDEFVVLLEQVAGEDGAPGAASEVAEALNSPFVLEEREVFVTASTGGVLGGAEGAGEEKRADPQNVLRSADVAMYRAKEGTKTATSFSSPPWTGAPDDDWRSGPASGELWSAGS